MTNPTFLWHVTMAVHEDRVRALQRSRWDRSGNASAPVRLTLGLFRRSKDGSLATPVRAEHQTLLSN